MTVIFLSRDDYEEIVRNVSVLFRDYHIDYYIHYVDHIVYYYIIIIYCFVVNYLFGTVILRYGALSALIRSL